MNWLKNAIADVLGLVTPDTILAIRPAFGADADKAKADGLRKQAQAGIKEARAAVLQAEAVVLRETGTRKTTAADKFRKATGE